MALRYLKQANSKKLTVEWINAPDVRKKVKNLVSSLGLKWIKSSKIVFFRSNNSKTNAYARIWGLSRVWQMALGKEPHYIIEVISEKYDKLSENEKNKILLHELAHIPKNFSGALVPHYRRGKRKFKDLVNNLVAQFDDVKKLKS